MNSLGGEISTWFWNPDIWLPPNVDWDTFKEEKVINTTVIKPEHFAKFSDLWYPIPIGLVFIIVRFIVEKNILKPLGYRLGLKNKPHRKPPTNQILENHYKTKSKLLKGDASLLSQKSGLSDIQVERWFRDRRRADTPSTITKFCEGGWRFIFYSCIFLYGMAVMYNKPWLWDVNASMEGYPYHTIGWDIWLYYMLEIGFYMSLCVTQFSDVKRKDFVQNMVHHIVTILLMMFSWSCHFIRIGTLVLILHDCSDPLLELAKLCKYVKKDQIAEIVFGCFTVTWIVTRCFLFPSRVLYSTLHAANKYIEMFPGYYFFNSLLIVLQFLNVMWTVMILKIAINALMQGNVEDSRSDSEDSSSDEDDKKKSK